MAKQKKKRVSKKTVRSEGAHKRLTETANEFGGKLDERFNELYSTYRQEGETLPQPSALLVQGLRRLDDLHERLVTGDKTRIEEAIERSFARENLDEKKRRLLKRMNMIANTVEASHGEAGLRAVPYRAADARSLDGALNQAEMIYDRLMNFNLPEAVTDSQSSAAAIMPPPDILAQSLRTRIDEFKAARDEYEKEKRQVTAAQAEQRSAIEEFEDSEKRFRGFMKALFNFVELDHLADTLRVSSSSSGTDDPPTSEGPPPIQEAA